MLADADARIPVRLGRRVGEAPAGSALLIEGLAGSPGERPTDHFLLRPRGAGHPLGCACCGPRGAAATALARLFLARARGELSFEAVFAVVAGPAGEAAIRAALVEDALVAARYRLAS
jgi:hypothetical protein